MGCCLRVILCKTSCSLSRCQQLSSILAHKSTLSDGLSSSHTPSLPVSTFRHVHLEHHEGYDDLGCKHLRGQR